MSASLVGSEMCIRDSSCQSLLGAALPLAAAPGILPLALMVLLPLHLLSCLLYTSDAADDM
eukprot:11803179-Alexandrium_andersonii.AAC.1